MTVRWLRLLTLTHLSQILRNQKNLLTTLQIFKEAKYKYPNYLCECPGITYHLIAKIDVKVLNRRLQIVLFGCGFAVSFEHWF